MPIDFKLKSNTSNTGKKLEGTDTLFLQLYIYIYIYTTKRMDQLMWGCSNLTRCLKFKFWVYITVLSESFDIHNGSTQLGQDCLSWRIPMV